MEIGQTVQFETDTFKDDLTGRPVRRLTGLNYRSHHQYFYFNMWTEDSKKVVITSNREDGIYRHYLLDTTTGEGLCLTDAENLAPHFGELSRDNLHLLYVAGRELRIRWLFDLTEQVVYRQSDPWTAIDVYYGATLDHANAVMVEMHKKDHVRPKEGWDAFPKQFKKKPRCRLVELDVKIGKSQVIHEENNWIGHPNYRPNSRTIMFCHEGPWQLVDSRIWFIDPDGAHLREAKKRQSDQPPGLDSGELWGHEFWLADSSRAGFIYFPLKFGIDATLRLLDPETLDETILMPVSAYSHFIFNRKNTHIVGDGKQPLADALYLADIESQKEAVLCPHGSSMKPYINLRTGRPNTQEVHPHPCFSPDSKKVLFTSDRHGTPAVYLVEI